MATAETLKRGEPANATAESKEGRGRPITEFASLRMSNGKPLAAYAKEKRESDDDGKPSGNLERVLTAKAIDCYSIDDAELSLREMKRELPEDALTRAGDVVISLRAPFQAACIDDDHEGIFVTNAFAIIRFGEGSDMDPWFLAAYLNLDSVRDSLGSMTTGGRWPSLRLSQLMKVEIPPIDKPMRKALGDLARAAAACAAERRRQEAAQEKYMSYAFEEALEKAGWQHGK